MISVSYFAHDFAMTAMRYMKDWVRVVCITLWILILLIPLKGINRRDPISGMMYSLFCTAAGTALLIAIPQKYALDMPLRSQLNLILFMSVFSALRWSFLGEGALVEKAGKKKGDMTRGQASKIR